MKFMSCNHNSIRGKGELRDDPLVLACALGLEAAQTIDSSPIKISLTIENKQMNPNNRK